LPGKEIFIQLTDGAVRPAVLWDHRSSLATDLLGQHLSESVCRDGMPWSAGASCPSNPASVLPAGCWRAHCRLHFIIFSLMFTTTLLENKLFGKKKVHLVCTAQVTEMCIFLLNTRLMINN